MPVGCVQARGAHIEARYSRGEQRLRERAAADIAVAEHERAAHGAVRQLRLPAQAPAQLVPRVGPGGCGAEELRDGSQPTAYRGLHAREARCYATRVAVA